MLKNKNTLFLYCSYRNFLIVFLCCFTLFFSHIVFAEEKKEFGVEQNKAKQNTFNNDAAQYIYENAKKSVFQIRVISNKSAQKYSIGSGFRVAPHNVIISNYHVVAGAALFPEDYSLEYIGYDGQRRALKIKNIDVINDIAVLDTVDVLEPSAEIDPSKTMNTSNTSANTSNISTDIAILSKQEPGLVISNESIKQGASVYSIGNPHDLGMTIVDGVYNGLLEESLYQKILFSGALNSGMSGGPAFNAKGEVIGINVATSGDDLGYLVPIKFAEQLLKKTQEKALWENVVAQQLLENSDVVIEDLTKISWPTIEFGEYNIPEGVNSAFKCWGAGHSEKNEKNYSYANFVCSTQDSLFVSAGLSTGKIKYGLTRLQSSSMNPLAFSRFYESYYQYPASDNIYTKTTEDVERFTCKSSFVNLVENDRWKIALCARPYKKLDALYDVFLKAAIMGKKQEGYILEIFLEGVSYKSSQEFIQKFLETIQ